MKLKILLLFLSLVLLLCACDGATPNTDGHTTEGTTEANTVATEAPYVSQATSLFTLLEEIDYGDFTAYTGILPPGPTPVEYLPPANEELIGKEMTVNPSLEKDSLYFYYCKNEAHQTERLALILNGGAAENDVKYPLLIIADVNFGSAEAFKAALEQKKDFSIRIVATANLCSYEAKILTYIAIHAAKQSNTTVPYPEGIVEYFGITGGTEELVFAPRLTYNGFHTVFDRHSMTEIMGIYVEESDN